MKIFSPLAVRSAMYNFLFCLSSLHAGGWETVHFRASNSSKGDVKAQGTANLVVTSAFAGYQPNIVEDASITFDVDSNWSRGSLWFWLTPALPSKSQLLMNVNPEGGSLKDGSYIVYPNIRLGTGTGYQKALSFTGGLRASKIPINLTLSNPIDSSISSPTSYTLYIQIMQD